MSKPMKVKVKYVQGHLYIYNNILIFEIYRRCQAAIPIFDILVWFRSYGRKTEPICGNLPIFWVFFDQPDPHRQKFKILARQNLMTTVSELSWKFGWNRSCRFGEFSLKKDKPSQNKRSRVARSKNNNLIFENIKTWTRARIWKPC